MRAGVGVIVSVLNVTQCTVRRNLIMGRFDYCRCGFSSEQEMSACREEAT